MVNRLTFAPGESRKFGLHFWEPVVDGRLLRQLITDVPGDEAADWVVGGDNVPVLVHSWRVGLPDDVLVLLGEKPSELANGRIPIWVCAACGDLGCGAVTVAVEWSADTVVWRDFGWDDFNETDLEDDIFSGSLIFDRKQYEAELRRFVDTFDEVRSSLPAELRHDVETDPSMGRRRRWKWLRR